MADIELVIRIPEEEYNIIKKFNAPMTWAEHLIAAGTPLPKGHGKIIDYGYVVDAIDDWVNAEEYRYTNATDYLRKRVANTPTIIEADTESKVQEMTRDEAKSILFDMLGNTTIIEPTEQNQAILTAIKALEQTKWIPVSERPPEDLEPVNITWVNHNPESYYADIKDKPFTATGVYFNGQWYWWSTLCADILAEYSHNYDDVIDEDIEIIAWQPLPEPYKAESEDAE